MIKWSIKFLLLLLLISCNMQNKISKNETSYVKIIKEYRKTYKEGFITDPRSPLQKSDLKQLDFYIPDENWKFNAQFSKNEIPKPFELPTYSGLTRTYIVYGYLTFALKKDTFVMEVYKNIQQPINPLYKNNLFLPFKDHTNGEQTYGGGRYINLDVTDINDGFLEVDFNKAYNPWCAYSSGYNCPIPPIANHLDIEVTVGEKQYKGKYKTKE
jgi:uncharacterized protein (DUF1684 family)